MDKQKKIKELYLECIKELNAIGIGFENKEINIQISKRNNKRYGCCRPENPDEKYKTIKRKGFKFIIKYENYQKYTIEISPWVMELNEEIIKNTIIHELIHCMPYCTNHGKEFKQYAKIVNEKLGYNITRTGNKQEDYQKSNIEYEAKNDYKYKIQCKKCGQIYYRKRLEKNFTKKYRCGKCKGELIIVKNKFEINVINLK